MAMTFDNLKKRAGKMLLLYDDTNGWKTGRDVSETDIGEFVNDLYVNEVFPLFVAHYPFDFRMTGTADSWIANGTASAGLASTTLTTTTSIFANSMVGLTVWNDTDSTSAIITAYTSATTVTMDGSVATWSNDSIYVLGQEFVFGGDATDIFDIEEVGVKYTSADTFFRPAQQRDKWDFYQWGGEQGSQLVPQYYLTNVSVSGVAKPALGLIPNMTSKLSKAVQISYIAKPVAMSSASDTPRIAHIELALYYGAIARGYYMMQDTTNGKLWDQKYQVELNKALQRYKPTSTGRTPFAQLPRRAGLMARRLV